MNLADPNLVAEARLQATAVSAPGAHHVVVLMGVYNGARFLPDQLASFSGQKHKDWSLIVGDDGSTDGSADLLHEFAKDHPCHSVRVVPGPRQGFQANFLSLLRHCPDHARFVAFSDQDDVWLPGKLARGIARLGSVSEEQPALYCGRTIVTDADLSDQGVSPLFSRAPSFANALVQSLAGGNTMIFNRAAADLLAAAARRTDQVVSHDWWAYQVITGAGGAVIYDQEPQVLYRQHGQNLIGSGLRLSAKYDRAKRLMQGELRGYMTTNLAALSAIRDLLTQDARQKLDAVTDCRSKGPLRRLAAYRSAGVYRQTVAGSASLWAAAALGRA